MHNRSHERDEVESLYRQRAWPPDQREAKQPEAHIAQDLANDVETRVWCPGGISRVRPVEIGDNGKRRRAMRMRSKLMAIPNTASQYSQVWTSADRKTAHFDR